MDPVLAPPPGFIEDSEPPSSFADVSGGPLVEGSSEQEASFDDAVSQIAALTEQDSFAPAPLPDGFVEDTETSALDTVLGGAETTARQFVSGIDDVTALLVSPLQALFGDVEISPDGVRFLTPEQVKQARRKGELGIAGRPEPEPDNLLGSAARLAGQAAAFGPIVGRSLGAVSAPSATATTKLGRAGQFVQRAASEAGQTFSRSPVKVTAGETALGGAAGAGGFVATQIFPDSDSAKFVGEIVGGTAPTLTPTGLAIRAANKAKDLVQIARHPFTEIGGRRRAQERADRAVPDARREEVASNLDDPAVIDPATGEPVLTPAQRTGEQGLLSLERAVVESTEQLTREGDEQIAHANEVIQRAISDISDTPSGVAASTIEEAQAYLDNLLDVRLRVAARATDERISALGPKASREQTNLIANEEIRAALKAARDQESDLFSIIPQDTPAPFDSVESLYNSFLREIGQAQKSDIPSVAKRLLNPKLDTFIGKDGLTDIKELRALQSKLRQEARNARAGDRKNLNKARIADALADSITDDLSNAHGGPEIADNIKAAVGFSRDLNERFSQGTVGKILGRRSAGDASVRPGLTLEESIGVTGPKAREALDDIVRAFDSPEAPSSRVTIEAAQDYFRSRFLKAATDQGQLNVRSANRFIDSHDEVLKRLPGLKAQLEEAVKFGNILSLREAQRSRVKFSDPRLSKATMLIERGPVDTFKNISRLKPSQAAKEAKNLANIVARDKTGEALNGLKSGFLEFVLSGARGKARDINGRQFLSGFAIRDALTNPSTNEIASKILNKEELARLQIITNDLIKLEKRLAAPIPAEGVLGDKPSRLVETIAGITGAAIGRQQGRNLGVGGTVQIPGIVANRFRELAKAGVSDPASRLIHDAIYDEGLFKTLLMAPVDKATGQLTKEASRRLNAWAIAVLIENGGYYDEE